MSLYIFLQVLVPLLSFNLFVHGQMYGYPAQYSQPYPYAQQYPNFGSDMSNFGAQGYPQVYSQNYPYPYQPVYPGVPNYAQQYPSYPSYRPITYPGSMPQGYPDQSQYPISAPQGYPDQSQYPISAPQGYPDQSQNPISEPQGYSDQSQYPVSVPPSQYPTGTNVYPSNYPVPIPQSISTPYGNIPVEIIDVDGSVEQQIIGEPSVNDTGTQLTPVLTESKSIFDVISKPAKSTKYVQMSPSQTKIVRTVDPKRGKIHVEIQTNSPIPSKDKENDDNNNEENNAEDNETTTKSWSMFG